MGSQVQHRAQPKHRVPRLKNHQSVVTVEQLTATYPCQDSLPTRESAVSLDAVLSLVLSKESSDQLSNRICCYAFAKAKGRYHSLNTIIQHTARANDPTTKYYHPLECGYRWGEIIDWISQNLQCKLTGIIAVLGKRRLWERAKPHTWQAALAYLSKNTDMIECARQSTAHVDAILQPIKNTLFFDRPTGAMPKSNLRPSYNRKEPAIRGNSSPTTTRSYHTKPATSQWKVASMAAASGVLPELKRAHADTSLLLVLLCFLDDSILHRDLLLRGTTPRKRWNDIGGIEDIDALYLGLSSDLVSICSSPTKLGEFFRQLESFSAISKISDYTCRLDKSLTAAVIGRIPTEFHQFWRLQVLIIACHSIPWKYLENPPLNMELFLPHIRHTLQEVQKHRILDNMSPAIRTNVALSLLEASRFPGMEWKRFAISQSKQILSNVRDDYVQSYIAPREALLHRITSSKGQSFQPPKNSQHEAAPGCISRRLHSGSGHGAIQRALDQIQVEELTKASEILAAWEPIFPPSLIEIVVLFRKHIIMGKIEWYRGNFKDSLAHLMLSTNIVNDYKDVVFLEDSSDLVCSLADTYLELEDPVAAERCLCAEIAQQSTGSGTLLKLVLAESLLAQDRRLEAEVICNEIKSLPKLLKMEKLRLSITLAKLSHINAKYNEALGHWTDAMTAISRYNLANGHATRIILLSMCDVLHQATNLDTGMKLQSQLRTQEQLKIIEALAEPTGVFYWIGGLRHWLKYLESINRSRM